MQNTNNNPSQVFHRWTLIGADQWIAFGTDARGTRWIARLTEAHPAGPAGYAWDVRRETADCAAASGTVEGPSVWENACRACDQAVADDSKPSASYEASEVADRIFGDIRVADHVPASWNGSAVDDCDVEDALEAARFAFEYELTETLRKSGSFR